MRRLAGAVGPLGQPFSRPSRAIAICTSSRASVSALPFSAPDASRSRASAAVPRQDRGHVDPGDAPATSRRPGIPGATVQLHPPCAACGKCAFAVHGRGCKFCCGECDRDGASASSSGLPVGDVDRSPAGWDRRKPRAQAPPSWSTAAMRSSDVACTCCSSVRARVDVQLQDVRVGHLTGVAAVDGHLAVCRAVSTVAAATRRRAGGQRSRTPRSPASGPGRRVVCGGRHLSRSTRRNIRRGGAIERGCSTGPLRGSCRWQGD